MVDRTSGVPSKQAALGKPLEVYGPNYATFFVKNMFAGGLITVGIGLLIVASLEIGPFSTTGLSAVWPVCLPLLLISAFLIVSNARKIQTKILLYEDAAVYVQAGNQLKFRWDEIAEAAWLDVTSYYHWGLMYMGTTYKFRLRRNDGCTVVLTEEIKRIDILGEYLIQEVTRRRLAQAEET